MCVFEFNFTAFASVSYQFDFRHVLSICLSIILIVRLVCMGYKYLFHTSSALPSFLNTDDSLTDFLCILIDDITFIIIKINAG